jgi:hypothetical protein
MCAICLPFVSSYNNENITQIEVEFNSSFDRKKDDRQTDI